MDKLKGAAKAVAVVALVIAALPNLATATDGIKNVLVTNTEDQSVPVTPQGTTTVEGGVAVTNSPAVEVANTPAVTLKGSENLVRAADETTVIFNDLWEDDGSFLGFARGVSVIPFKTVRYLVKRQAFCSTPVKYEVSANMDFGPSTYTIDEGTIPATGEDNVRTGVVELPGRFVSIDINAGTAESPCLGFVALVGRRN